MTLARQRGGPARAWFAKQEHHPCAALHRGDRSSVGHFLRQGHWGHIRDHRALKQVIHDSHFYTPEACTNWAESGFRVLFGMRMIYRKIIGNYIDLYTAQLTWRLSHTGVSDDDSFAARLGTMMTPGRSPMAGYFPDPQLPAWDYGVWRNSYIGQGYSLRERITAHLLGGIGESPFRQSIFAIHWVAGTDELGELKHREASEAAMNDWLRHEVVIGYKV